MKHYKLRAALIVLFNLFLFISAKGQETEQQWNLIKENEGVSYYYRSSLCNETSVFFFKVENTTNSIKNLKVQIEISESGKLNSTGKIFATLANGGVQVGNCDMMSNPALKVRLEDNYQNPVFTITEIL